MATTKGSFSSISYQDLFNQLPEAILLIDNGIIIDCNAASLDLFACGSKKEIVGKDLVTLSPAKQFDDFVECYHNGQASFECVFAKKNGQPFAAEMLLTTLTGNNPALICALIKEKSLQRDQLQLYCPLQDHDVVALVVDPDTGCIVEANPSACAFYGIEHDRLLEKRITDITQITNGNAITELFRSQLPKANRYEFIQRVANGKRKKVKAYTGPIQYADKKRTLWVIFDVSKYEKQVEAIKQRSYCDQVTGLYNRTYFQIQTQKLNENPDRLPVSIIMGDANGLKLVNDTLGHSEGDQLLREIAAILISCSRRSDIVARIGGDEFIMVMPQTSHEQALEISEHISKMCASSSLKIKPSIALGCATKTSMDQNIWNVSVLADTRMYKNKAKMATEAMQRIVTSIRKQLLNTKALS